MTEHEVALSASPDLGPALSSPKLSTRSTDSFAFEVHTAPIMTHDSKPTRCCMGTQTTTEAHVNGVRRGKNAARDQQRNGHEVGGNRFPRQTIVFDVLCLTVSV